MDTRLRYGLGVTVLGLGNLTVGLAQLLVGTQPMLTVGLELAIGTLLSAFGLAVVSDPDRVDPERISPRVLTAVGWIGLVLGAIMVGWSILTVVLSVV